MWYVRQAKSQISLRIGAVWSELLLVAFSVTAKLLTEHNLELLSLTGELAQACLSLHLSN